MYSKNDKNIYDFNDGDHMTLEYVKKKLQKKADSKIKSNYLNFSNPNSKSKNSDIGAKEKHSNELGTSSLHNQINISTHSNNFQINNMKK